VPYQMTVSTLPDGVPSIQLPNGIEAKAGYTYTLSDDEAAQISPLLAANGLVSLNYVASTYANAAITLTSSALSAATYDVATTAATTSTPYGYSTAAQAEGIVTTVNALVAAYNQLQADVANINAKLG